MNKTKKAISLGLVALVLCLSMLLGTTYAWFTDSVTSSGNIIQSGNLDLQVFWTDDISDSNSWRDAGDTENPEPIFNYDKWEPGYTCVRYIKIVNKGNLAFKYLMNIIPDGEVSDLAEVIDVYYVNDYRFDPATGKVTSVGDMTHAGTLDYALANRIPQQSTLLPKSAENSGEVVVAIALKMQESAGNEYQNKSIGSTFSIQFLATQLANEEDSFGYDYDEESKYPVVYVASTKVEVVEDANGNKTVKDATRAASANGEISVVVNAGTAVNGSTLTGKVSQLSSSTSNLVASNGKVLVPYDIHVDGIAEGNDVPVLVTVKEFMEYGLLPTDGYTLWHVEDGVTTPMTEVSSLAELDAHNEFYYDSATGDVTVALCSFSEVVADMPVIIRWSGNTTVDLEESEDEDGNVTMTVKEDTNFTSTKGEVSFDVGAGTKVDGSTLTGSVTSLEETSSNFVANDGEVLVPVDIHVEGIAAGNTVPVIVTVDSFLNPGLNKGNYTIGHVENGVTNSMTEVDSLEELDAHNEFYYDSATGSVTFALCSFSEIVAVKSLVSKWTGKVAGSFAGGSGTEENPYLIANGDQLAYLGKLIGSGNAYSGKYFKLLCDIDLGWTGVEEGYVQFNPIGYYFTDDYDGDGIKDADEETSDVYSTIRAFKGIFDGNGKTIKNFYQNTWATKGDYNSGYPAKSNHYKDGFGLFGYLEGATVKNLTVENFSSDGEFTPTGTIAAYACNSTIENVSIINCNPRVYNTGNGGIIGIGGNSDDPDSYKITLKNITVDQTNKITALWGSWDVACGGLIGMFRGNGKVYMENCHVAAQIDVYNDVCGNYQYYWYRYAGMMIGTNKNMETDANGYTVPVTRNFTTKNCSVYIGDWNDYYYCELVANSLASYTHDHQFSRLTIIESEDDIKDESGNWDRTGSFLVIKSGDGAAVQGECYHIFKNSEGQLYRHFHDVEDATNPNIYETFDLNGNGSLDDLKEDHQIVYLPFNQICTGYGWGVKHIPVTESTTSTGNAEEGFGGVVVNSRGSQDSAQKFYPAAETSGTYVRHYPNGTTTIQLGGLFRALSAEEAAEVKFDQIVVSIAPSPDSTGYVKVLSTDIKATQDWRNSTFTVQGTGTFYVTISDYYFCKPTTVAVVIDPPKDIDDPFSAIEIPEGKTEITYTGSTYVAGMRVVAAGAGTTITKDATTNESIVKVNYSTSKGEFSTSSRYIDVNCQTQAGQQFTVEIDFKIEEGFVVEHFLSLLQLRGNYTVDPMVSQQVFHRNAGLTMVTDGESVEYWLSYTPNSEGESGKNPLKLLQVPAETWINLKVEYCFRGPSNDLYYVITGSYTDAEGTLRTLSSPKVKLNSMHSLSNRGYYVECVRIGARSSYGATNDARLKGVVAYKNFKMYTTSKDVNFDELNGALAFDQQSLNGSTVNAYVPSSGVTDWYLGNGVTLYTPSKVTHIDRVVEGNNAFMAINYHTYQSGGTWPSHIKIDSNANSTERVELSARFQLPSQVYLSTAGGFLATDKSWSAQGDFGNYNPDTKLGNPYISLFRLVGSEASRDLVAMKIISNVVTIFDPLTGAEFAKFETADDYADKWFTVDVSYDLETGKKTVTVKNETGAVIGQTEVDDVAFGADVIGVNVGCVQRAPDDRPIKGGEDESYVCSTRDDLSQNEATVHVPAVRRTLYVDDYSFVAVSDTVPGEGFVAGDNNDSSEGSDSDDEGGEAEPEANAQNNN